MNKKITKKHSGMLLPYKVRSQVHTLARNSSWKMLRGRIETHADSLSVAIAFND